jgi:hypothetical protein
MLAVSGAMLTLIEPQHGLHSLCSNPGVPGNIVRRGNGVMALECMEYNAADLPKSFGGTSGGGLWRAYLNVDEDGSYTEVETRLCGIASYQQDAMHIVCQGFERIEQALVVTIHRRWRA